MKHEQSIGVESHEIKLNYYAIAVAILGKCTVETAFEKLQCEHINKVRSTLTPEDTEDMRKLHSEGLPYSAIARIYDVYPNTIIGRLRPKREKVG